MWVETGGSITDPYFLGKLGAVMGLGVMADGISGVGGSLVLHHYLLLLEICFIDIVVPVTVS